MTQQVGQVGLGNLYGQYPNFGLAQGSTMNNDFMFNATQTPAFTGGYLSQPATDIYEKAANAAPQNSGSSPLTNGIGFGLLGAGATTAGMYYFGGKYVNPEFKNGVYEDNLLRRIEEDHAPKIEAERAKAEAAEYKRVFTENGQGKTFIHGQKSVTIENKADYDALKKLAETGEKPSSGALANIEKAEAEELLKQADAHKAANFSKDNITKAADELEAVYRRTKTLEGASAELEKLKGIKANLEALPENITRENLIKHIQSNPELFGLEGTEAEVKTAAERLVDNNGTFKGRAGLINEYGTKITTQDGVLNTVRKELTGKIPHNASGELAEGVSKEVTAAFRNTKLSKAFSHGWKAGVAALVAGVVGTWIFGKK